MYFSRKQHDMNSTLQADSKVLAIDIGGSHIKLMLLDAEGNALSERKRKPTPQPATPAAVVELITGLAAEVEAFQFATAGFPGFVKNGTVKTAPNLGTEHWADYPLQQELSKKLGVPALVVNDADFQGAGLVPGKGLEMVLTIGTGFGTALLLDGKLLPHLEVSQHPVTKSKNYDEYIGDKALQDIGEERWNVRMQRVLSIIKTVFNYDHLYISGGNAELLNFPLGENVSLKTNKEGLKGAAALWKYQ